MIPAAMQRGSRGCSHDLAFDSLNFHQVLCHADSGKVSKHADGRCDSTASRVQDAVAVHKQDLRVEVRARPVQLGKQCENAWRLSEGQEACFIRLRDTDMLGSLVNDLE